MPPDETDEGIQAAVRLRETHPDVGVVVLSQYAEPRYALALLEGGSARRAYLLKERVDDVEQLVGAIRAVADGGSVVDSKVVDALMADRGRTESSALDELTPRERDVLREMAEGKNNAAIGQALFVTERSVEKVIHSIFVKLGIAWEPEIHKRVKAVTVSNRNPIVASAAPATSRQKKYAAASTAGENRPIPFASTSCPAARSASTRPSGERSDG